jgi:hypothetical protein
LVLNKAVSCARAGGHDFHEAGVDSLTLSATELAEPSGFIEQQLAVYIRHIAERTRASRY